MSGVITGILTVPQIDGTVYSIDGLVEVGADAGTTAGGGTQGALTIEAGVVLFGEDEDDRLVVQRGSTIDAQGTATDPIVFTSRDDLLALTTPDSDGQWAGLTILGQAPISVCATGGTSNPGGTRTDCERDVQSTNLTFGGNIPDSNSGTLRFVQIRYAGRLTEALVLGGVGSGTVVANVQVHNSGDRGVLIDGGRVDAANIAVNGAEVEGFTSANGHQGALQFLLITQRSGTDFNGFSGGFSGFEDALPRGNFQLSNFTIVSTASTQAGMDVGGGGDYGLFNGIVAGADQCFSITDPETLRAADASLEDNGPPSINSVQLTCANPFRIRVGTTEAEVQALFDTGSNNNTAATSTLSMGFINGSNESAVTSFDPTAISSFFSNPGFIAAVESTSDARFQGWTCGLYSGPDCIGVAEAFD